MEVDLSDEALVEKFRQTKDTNSFKSLVRRYQNRIYNAAYRMLGSKEEAEEVVQETFIKMHQSINTFHEQASFGAWIFRISHNLCIDSLRIRQRRKGIRFLSFGTGTSPDGERDSSVQVPDSRPDPSQALDLGEQSKVIAESLASLPDSQRAVLVLHDIEGFSYQEVSEIVGANIGTVRSRLHYGRLKLKELLNPYYSTDMPAGGPQAASQPRQGERK